MIQIPQSTTRRVMLKLFSTGTTTAATGKTVPIKLSKAGGAFADPSAGATNATELSSGWYYADLSTTDTATLGDLIVRGTCAACDDTERLFGVVKATTGGLTGIPDAVAGASGGLPLSVDASGRVDVLKINGTSQTARDIGASVLLSTGTGTGQLDFTSGVVKANATQWVGGTIPAVNVTGVPLVDAKYLLGTVFSTPTVAGIPNVNTKTWNDLATVALPLVPTTAGRTLDVSAGGEAGVDWGNVGSPTTALALTGTTIATTQKVDIETIKTQAVTCAGGVTVPAATLASTTNITAGTMTTTTNLTNAPTSGDLTATMKTSVTTAATAATPTAAAVAGAVGSVTAGVTVTTNNDKTGYALTQSFPSNFAALGISVAGKVNGVVLVDTLTTYTGNTPQTGDAYGRIGATGSGLSSLAPASTALSNAQWTNARAAYLDNLNVGGNVASQADVQAINASASKHLLIQTVGQYERPESGSTTYTVEARTFSASTGAAVNADSDPTLTATGQTTGSLAANLGTVSNPSTGVYRWTYAVANNATTEPIRFDVSATIASSTFTLSCYSQVVDLVSVTWTGTDATHLTAIYNKLPVNNIADETLVLAAVSGLNNLSSAQAQTAAAAALTAYDAPTNTGLTSRTLPTASYATATAVAAVKADTATLLDRITSTLFSGITSLARWLGLLAGKTADASTLTEMQATVAGAGYSNLTDSQEALRDRGDTAWATAAGFAVPGDAMAITTASGNALVAATAAQVTTDHGAGSYIRNTEPDNATLTILAGMTEINTSYRRFKSTALEQAPGGGSDIAAIKAVTDQFTFTGDRVNATADVALTDQNVADIAAGVGEVVGEQLDLIQNKTDLIGLGDITVVYPLSPDGKTMTIIRGNDYFLAQGRRFEWTSANWPDLTGATVVFKSKYVETTGVLINSAKVGVEFTRVQTRAMQPGAPSTEFEVQAHFGNTAVITLIKGVIQLP